MTPRSVVPEVVEVLVFCLFGVFFLSLPFELVQEKRERGISSLDSAKSQSSAAFLGELPTSPVLPLRLS